MGRERPPKPKEDYSLSPLLNACCKLHYNFTASFDKLSAIRFSPFPRKKAPGRHGRCRSGASMSSGGGPGSGIHLLNVDCAAGRLSVQGIPPLGWVLFLALSPTLRHLRNLRGTFAGALYKVRWTSSGRACSCLCAFPVELTTSSMVKLGAAEGTVGKSRTRRPWWDIPGFLGHRRRSGFQEWPRCDRRGLVSDRDLATAFLNFS